MKNKLSLILLLVCVSFSVYAFDEDQDVADNSEPQSETQTAATPKPAPVSTSENADNAAAANPFTNMRAPIEVNYDEAMEREGCGAYDLRGAMQQRGLPARQFQGESGWCYAFVASDLVSYRLGHAVSAADIAINFINRNPEVVYGNNSSLAQNFPLGGGFTKEAIESLNGRGVCRQEDFPVDLSPEEPTAAIIEDPVTHARRKAEIPVPALNTSGLAKFFTDPRIHQRMSLISRISFINALNQLAARPQCQPSYANMNLRVDVETWSSAQTPGTPESRAAFNRRVNAWLDQHRMVGVSYEQDVLRSGASEHMRTQPVATHISSIVGRRFNAEKSRCEYLVRNSEGRCNYNSDFECENNHVWIPRQVLMWSVGLALSIGN